MSNDSTARPEYHLKIAVNAGTDEPEWTTIAVFNNPRTAGAQFYLADRARLPAVHEVSEGRDDRIGFTFPSGQWEYRNIVCDSAPILQAKEFACGYYDELERQAEDALARIAMTPSAPYDSRLHQDLEELCKYSCGDGIDRRSRLIGKWIQATQFEALSAEDKDAFAQLLAVHDSFDFEEGKSWSKQAATAIAENVRICEPYGDALKNNRRLCASLKNATGFDLNAAVHRLRQTWSLSLPTFVRSIDVIAPLTEEDAAISARHIGPMGQPYADVAVMARWQDDRTKKASWIHGFEHVRHAISPASSAASHLEAAVVPGSSDPAESLVRSGLAAKYEVSLYFTFSDGACVGSRVFVDEETGVLDAERAFKDMDGMTEDDPRDPDGQYLRAGGYSFAVERTATPSHFRVLDLEGLQWALAKDRQHQEKIDIKQAVVSGDRAADQVARATTNPTLTAQASEPVPVKALDWWSTQRALIQSSRGEAADAEESLRRLGPRPSSEQTWWFQNGRPCPPPSARSGAGERHDSTERHGKAPTALAPPGPKPAAPGSLTAINERSPACSIARRR